MWVHVSQQFTNIPYIRGQKLFLQNVLKCLVFCICIQSLQKVLLWHKPFCPEKYQYGYHKRRILWFYADFKFVDAAFKKCSIDCTVLPKNFGGDHICTFSKLWIQMQKSWTFSNILKKVKSYFFQYLSFSVWFILKFKKKYNTVSEAP